MKLLLILILSIQANVFATGTKDVKQEKFNQLAVDKSMEQLLEIEGVDKIYKSCQESYAESKASSDYASKISSCLWSVVQKDEKLKAQVTESYANLKKKEVAETTDKTADKKEKEGASRSPSSESSALSAKKINLTVGTAEDPAIAALNDFYAKKLNEVLDPQNALTKAERAAGTVAMVDHRKYIELYKSALGKTIVNAFTSYCLETDSSCQNDPIECDPTDKECIKYTCLIPKHQATRLENKKNNIANLTNGSIDLDNKGQDSKKWTKCIQEVTPICTESYTKEQYEAHKYSIDRACVIVDYVKSARENLKLTNEQITFYDDLDKNYKGVGYSQGFKEIDKDDKASADALSSITAKDIKDSLKSVDEKALAEIDMCFTEDEQTGESKIVDAEACKKFLNTNKEESVLALSEFELRQQIQADALSQELQDDDKLNKYLEEEGYTKEEIANLLKDPNSITLIREKILSRFNNEKNALIAEMRDRIKTKTSVEDGTVTKEDIDSLKKIKQELLGRTSDLAGSVQFNNIVSSYLSYEDKKGGASGRNVASLFAELDTMTEEEAKVFQEKIKEAELVDKKTTVELSLTNLNNIFLGYLKDDSKDDK